MSDADKPTPEQRFAEIKANNDKANACPRHEFSPNIPGIEGGSVAMFGKRIECKRCGAHLDLLFVNAYIRGYEAAGKNGNDIMPGWRPTGPERRRFFKGDADTQ